MRKLRKASISYRYSACEPRLPDFSTWLPKVYSPFSSNDQSDPKFSALGVSEGSTSALPPANAICPRQRTPKMDHASFMLPFFDTTISRSSPISSMLYLDLPQYVYQKLLGSLFSNKPAVGRAYLSGTDRSRTATAEIIVDLAVRQYQKQLLVYRLRGSTFGTIERRSTQSLKLAICRSVHVVSSCPKRRNRQTASALVLKG